MPGREGDDRPPHLRGQINIWDQRYMMQTWGRQSAGLEVGAGSLGPRPSMHARPLA